MNKARGGDGIPAWVFQWWVERGRSEIVARREEAKQSLNSRFKPVIKSMVLNYKV